MKASNWKTTTIGLITAGAAFVLFDPETFARWHWMVTLAKFIMIGGLGGLGVVGKDFDVHSTVGETIKASDVEAGKVAVATEKTLIANGNGK